MSINVELTPEEEARLRAAARRQGLAAEECARRMIAANLVDEPPAYTTAELFALWAAEDATDDPEELAARQREWEELRDALNATRREAGARILFP